MHGLTARAVPALAVLVVGLVACSSGGGTPTSPSTATPTSSAARSTSAPPVAPPGAWTLGLDSQPTRAAIAGDRIYVTSAGGMRFPPQIYLVDATTGQEVERRTVTGQPYDLLVAPDGRLWMAGDRHPDQAGGAGINVHDPDSLLVVAHADLPGPAYSLALVGEEIWVGSDDAIFGLDPSTLELVRTLPIGGPAYQLIDLPSGDDLLAVEGGRLELIRSDGSVAASQPVEASGNVSAAATSSAVFVRVPVDADSTVLTLDPALSAPGQPVGVDADSAGGGVLATSAGDVVIVDDRRDEVVCLPAGAGPPVRSTSTDVVGVLDQLTDGRLLFAAPSGVVAREVAC